MMGYGKTKDSWIQMNTPDIVAIHVGCNDISPRQKKSLRRKKLRIKLLVFGSHCWDKGVNEIIIFSFICPTGQYYNSRAMKVNNYLQKFCFENEFYFFGIQKSREIIYSKVACIY